MTPLLHIVSAGACISIINQSVFSMCATCKATNDIIHRKKKMKKSAKKKKKIEEKTYLLKSERLKKKMVAGLYVLPFELPVAGLYFLAAWYVL